VLHYSFLNVAAALLVLLGPVPCARWLAGRSTVPHALAAIVWWGVLQSALGTLLGAFHLLRPGPILACESALFASMAILRRSTPTGRSTALSSLGGLSRLLALALAGLGLVLLVRGLYQPVTDIDSLAYHLPFAVIWMQQGWLAVVPEFSRYPWGYYPGGWEMISALLMFPLGDDLLSTVPSFLSWIAFVLAIVSLGSAGSGEEPAARAVDAPHAGASPARGQPPTHTTGAIACACIVAAFPITLLSATAVRVDLGLAALFLTAVLAGLTYRESRNPYDLALFLVASGMLPAVKVSGFAYAAMSWLVLLPWRRGASLRHWSVAASLIVALLLSSVWYLRNMALTGNPLGVVRISLFGHVLFDGWITLARVRRGALATDFRLSSLSDWQVYARSALGWLGVGFPLLLVLARPSFALLREPRYRTLLALAALSLAVYALTPYSATVAAPFRVGASTGFQMRFALPVLGLLAALAARGLQHLRAAVAPTLVSLAALGLVTFAICTQFTGADALLLLLVWGLAGAAVLQAPRRHWTRSYALAFYVVCLLQAVLLVGGRRHATRLDGYDPSYGDLSALAPGTRVGHLGDGNSYYLYGERLDLVVSETPRGGGDFVSWRRSLQSRGIGVLAVGPFARGLPPDVRACLRELGRPDSGFTRVIGEDPRKDILLYRLP
jgi:hypothetical protein